MEENILELLDRCEISLDDLCKARSIIAQGSNAMCTPFSTDSFKELIENGFENKNKLYGSKPSLLQRNS